MPLRRWTIERKPIKSKKLRPPRIYKRKGVKYIRPGKNKIKVSDVNLIINNHIASRSRSGYQRGYRRYRSYQKKAKELMELRAKLKQQQADLLISENKKKEALRMQQIKEEALAKTDSEKVSLLAIHKKELKSLNDDHAKYSKRLLERINDETKTIEEREDDIRKEIKAEDKRKRSEASKKGWADRKKGISETNAAFDTIGKPPGAAAKPTKGKAVPLEESPATTPISPLPAMPTRKPPIVRPTSAIAAAEPIVDLPDVEGYDGEDRPAVAAPRPPPLDIPDDDAILMIPTISETGDGKKHGGPNGMSNYQIDAAMEDEPMYLKTISADQIPELDLMANLALDEYKQCGFIVNTDPLGVTETQHWTAVYIDCDDENICYYYDSFGEPPTPLIAAGLKTLVSRLDIPHYLAFEYNTIVNQDENSSRCGIHCILTLTDLFAGMSTEMASDHSEQAAKAFQHYI